MRRVCARHLQQQITRKSQHEVVELVFISCVGVTGSFILCSSSWNILLVLMSLAHSWAGGGRVGAYFLC